MNGLLLPLLCLLLEFKFNYVTLTLCQILNILVVLSASLAALAAASCNLEIWSLTYFSCVVDSKARQ